MRVTWSPRLVGPIKAWYHLGDLLLMCGHCTAKLAHQCGRVLVGGLPPPTCLPPGGDKGVSRGEYFVKVCAQVDGLKRPEDRAHPA